MKTLKVFTLGDAIPGGSTFIGQTTVKKEDGGTWVSVHPGYVYEVPDPAGEKGVGKLISYETYWQEAAAVCLKWVDSPARKDVCQAIQDLAKALGLSPPGKEGDSQ